MIILGNTHSLEAKLSGAAATTELPIVASWFELATGTMDASNIASSTTITAGAAAVTFVVDPGPGKARQVKFITIRNSDTATVSLTVQFNDNGTKRILWGGNLAVGDSFIYTDGEGIRVVDSAGRVKYATSATIGSVQTDIFVPINLQTVFLLSLLPALGGLLDFKINSGVQILGSDYTQMGQTITWLNNGFTISATDSVVATYQV